MNTLFDLEVGHSLETISIKNVPSIWITRYAEVSKDFNPIHVDQEAAQQKGFDQPIVHGMLTMGLTGRILSSYMNAHLLIQRMNVTFLAPLQVGDGVELTGVIKEKSAAEVNVEVTGMSSSGHRVIRGEIVVKNRKINSQKIVSIVS